MGGTIKVLSNGLFVCRHFSAGAAALEKKNRGYNFFSTKKKKGKVGSTRSKQPNIPLTDEQEKVLEAALNGKNVFTMGSAGTGKTLLLERLIKDLRKLHGKNRVHVTASTGVAACALRGQTLHSFAGIGLGVDDDKDYKKSMLDRVLLDSRACSRWKRVKVLCIDEISMVDAKTFEALAYVARSLRSGEVGDHGNNTWGGIQLIVCGDFFQLPPVLKNKKVGKIFAFEADCWNESFDVQVELTKIFRQSDSLLIQLLQGMRKGQCDPDDLKFLEGCCSSCEPDPSAVRLFPRTAKVNSVNKEKLESLGQEIYVCRAQDSGEVKWIRQLKSGIVPEELEICVGARVMLIKNINPWRKLVNGATGTVVDLLEVSKEKYEVYGTCSSSERCVLPVVMFDSGTELLVEPEVSVIMDGDKAVAWRKQVPLILSWALSIHKCQGMTLDKLHTDLSQVFDFGMVYVAISRVKSLEGLSLSGLNPSKIKAHPKVLEFYRGFNKENIS